MIKHRFPNGVRLVMEQIPTCRSVSFGIWVKTGSRNETPATNGISHFIEHMLFKGTSRRSARDIAETFDGIGGNVNAFTAKEYTCYYAKVLDEHLPLAVDVLADMFFHSSLDPQELDKERNVILEEIAMYEDTPDDLVHDLMAKAVYRDHPLGYPILGTADLLNSFQSADLKGYMDSYYNADNTVLSLAGNIPGGTVELLEKLFSGMPPAKGAPDESAPQFAGEQLFVKKQTEQNHICLSLPGCSLEDKLLYPILLLNNAIGGGMSSRLFQEIREKRGLAYSVYSYHSAHSDNGLFTIYLGTAPKQTDEVLKVMLEILEEVAANGITEGELKKGKEQMKGSLILSLESTSSRMNRLGKNELMIGRHYSLDELIARIDSVTLEDTKKAAEKMFSQAFALAMVGQSDKPIRGFNRNPLLK